MKIKFTDERIQSYSNGPYHFINDGEPIEVSPVLVDDFLAARFPLDGVMAPTFELVEDTEEATESQSSDESEEEETVESLTKKFSRTELEQMAIDAGLDGNTYTNKAELATAIIAAKQEN